MYCQIKLPGTLSDRRVFLSRKNIEKKIKSKILKNFHRIRDFENFESENYFHKTQEVFCGPQ